MSAGINNTGGDAGKAVFTCLAMCGKMHTIACSCTELLCRSQRHAECVAYLLLHGADVYAQSSKKDNAMHIAARHGSAGALSALLSFRPHGDGEDGSQLLGDIVVQGDAGPTRFIDLHNGRPVKSANPFRMHLCGPLLSH